MSDSEPEWHIVKKSTWKPITTDLGKGKMKWLYDALAQSSTREEREVVLRRTIHFPYSMFSNLMKSVNDVFEKHLSCPPADYNHECYKELKHVLNDFQRVLKDKRIISDSGEPVRFTLNRTPRSTTPTPRPTTPRPTTPRPTTPSPSPSLFLHYNPDPLPIGPNTYMLKIPDFKLRLFATMILDRTTEEEKRTFIKKYMVIKYENDDSDMPMPHDVETLDRVILTILSKLRGNASTQIKTQKLLDYLKQLKNFTQYPASIYVLFPLPDPNPAALPIGTNTHMGNIPDFKLRMFAIMILDLITDEEKRQFMRKYVHVDEPFPQLVDEIDEIIEDIVLTRNHDDDVNRESKIKPIYDHLLHLKNTYPEVMHVLYPFPVMHSNAFGSRKRRGGKRRRQRRTARKLR
jgi:hypothetical protein